MGRESRIFGMSRNVAAGAMLAAAVAAGAALATPGLVESPDEAILRNAQAHSCDRPGCTFCASEREREGTGRAELVDVTDGGYWFEAPWTDGPVWIPADEE